MIYIGLIHNNEVERLDYLRPLLEKLISKLGAIYIEEHEQSFERVTHLDFISREYTFQNVRNRWKWKNHGRFFLNRRMLAFPTILLKSFPPKARKSYHKKMQVEDALARKHLSILKKFVFNANPGDSLIVFENDVVIPNFEELLREIQRFDQDIDLWTFVLLNAHYHHQVVGLSDSNLLLTDKSFGQEASINRLVTNTLACYRTSFELASEILVASKKYSTKFLLTPDWLFNAIFMDIEKNSKRKFSTKWFIPNLCENGSLTGSYLTENPSI
jgi:hypothetical protein